MADVDDRIDELFELTPEAFTAARNALAADLKKAGDERAAEVKALRRPSVAAWAVNRVARAEPAKLEQLVDAGQAMRAAQGKLLKGRGTDELEEAAGRRRRLVGELTRRAEALLKEADRPAPASVLDAVSNTLLATATDEVAARRVLRARLEKELPTPAGFGGLVAADAPEAPPARGKGRKGPAAVPSPRAEAARKREREKAEKAASAADTAEKEAGRLRAAAKDAERAAAEATRVAERARREADRARAAADRTSERAAGLRERADRARARAEIE